MVVVDVLDHNGGKLSIFRLNSLYAGGIGVEAELAASCDGNIVPQGWDGDTTSGVKKRLGRGGDVVRDVDVDGGGIVVRIDGDRSVLVVPGLTWSERVRKSTAEIVIFDILVESAGERVVERKVCGCCRGECEQRYYSRGGRVFHCGGIVRGSAVRILSEGAQEKPR